MTSASQVGTRGGAAVPGPPTGGVDRLLHWRADGVSLVLATDPVGGLLPRAVHWGADLGELDDEALAGLVLAAAPPVSEHPTDMVLSLIHI